MTNLQRLIAETTESMGRAYRDRGYRGDRLAYIHADPHECPFCILQVEHTQEQHTAATVCSLEVH